MPLPTTRRPKVERLIGKMEPNGIPVGWHAVARIPIRSEPQGLGAGVGHIRALFLGTTYAGHATRFANLQHHVLEDGRLSADFRPVTGRKEGGLLERVPVVRSVGGRARADMLKTR